MLRLKMPIAMLFAQCVGKGALDLSPAGRGRIEPATAGSVRVRGLDHFRKKTLALRAAETSAEARLWRELRNRQLDRWKFRRQHPIDRYVVDFVTIAGKLIVEVDGATHSTKRELSHDSRRTKTLETLGFRVVRVTNEDVRANLDGVMQMIWSELNPGEG